MQRIASWLAARPYHGLLALVVSLLLPLSPLVSGLLMVHLTLANGPRISLVQGAVASGVLAVVALIVSASVGQITLSAATTWLPALFLAGMVRYWRSVTMTLQVAAIIAMAATLGFYVVLGDPADYWTAVLANSATLFRESGLVEQADLLLASRDVIVPQMTMLFVFLTWSLFSAVFLLGYALFQQLPGKSAVYGRFCDLNFGRVLAGIVAVASVLGFATGWAWLQNVAFVVFAIFWLQGLAVMHWLHAERNLPYFAVIAAYALLPFLNVLLFMALAVLGYTDAWFHYRRQRAAGGKD